MNRLRKHFFKVFLHSQIKMNQQINNEIPALSLKELNQQINYEIPELSKKEKRSLRNARYVSI